MNSKSFRSHVNNISEDKSLNKHNQIHSYSLHIFLFSLKIPIPFADLEELYLFMFGLNLVNDEFLFVIWDLKYNRIIDIFEKSNA